MRFRRRTRPLKAKTANSTSRTTTPRTINSATTSAYYGGPRPSAASSALSPLTSTSSVSALNLSLPKVSVSSTGAADNKSVPSIDLTTPLTSGTINPLSLSSVVDATQGAASGLNSTLNNVGVV